MQWSREVKQLLNEFIRNESGAVTTDWVVLAAGVAFMGVVFAAPIGDKAIEVAERIGIQVEAVEIPTE